ncbi:DUF4065 domain-containing protein [Kineosporia sp. J2-2]|uniref:DUF4065 domain-containing protein n=1 Tax=Kineosporia corallincola TaxID=2835133 RepID=A0ABS5TNL5_9ACTN|nr:type II toxin-antitoxin system antitoxin SocA domain-containing protein [Kineosporia corallincola]MBT0772585.1 DUF4065 domain-containing protein [Kineosporia corallincola]
MTTWDGVSDFYEEDEPPETIVSVLRAPENVVTAHPVSVLDLAAAILHECPQAGELKLQKLCYYTQAEHLVLTGEPLFPERIEAWAAGPVVRELWKQRRYQSEALGNAALVEQHPTGRTALHNTLGRYRDWTGAQLSELSHREGPWLAAREGLAPEASSSTEIRLSDIRSYYERLATIPDESP